MFKIKFNSNPYPRADNPFINKIAIINQLNNIYSECATIRGNALERQEKVHNSNNVFVLCYCTSLLPTSANNGTLGQMCCEWFVGSRAAIKGLGNISRKRINRETGRPKQNIL